MQQDVERVLISEAEIKAKIAELGAQISADFAGKDLVVVGILKGAALFCSDLFRAITIPAELDFMRISSYGAATKSTGVHRVLLDLDYTLEGRHVLIVEDIVDTGLTIKFLKDYLSQRGPASLKVAALLDKPSRRKVPVTVDYRGFEVPDFFVVGMGLDFREKYRNLREICILKPEIYES
ncbi:hypoxanthine phosphoribosyltransferase [Symbiobacterium terraclitae]|uniref:Hypoxanthine phosphoribosyltransferase n=1 Tax=Symbiobacterium terraclitae TaxID=557451 RepID=A0ABS4JQU6_9FIRM|nr:hypoxanthine phosphoribosyltransferase [Symbiobacterium terraclitae]